MTREQTLRVEGASSVWTGSRELIGASITCRSGAVADLEGKLASDAVLDASGCVVTPGLVNAHHHLVQCGFRTLSEARHVPMRRWLAAMSAAYEHAGVDPELGLAASRVGLAEALLCGVTTVADHQLLWPAGVDALALASATVQAARELGCRLVFVRGSAGGDPEHAAASIEEMVGALGLGARGESADAMVQLAVGPAGVHSDRRETFELFAQAAKRHGLRRRTQANEQVDVQVARRLYRRRPIDLLEEWGWLEPDVTLAHLCRITPAELRRLSASGVSATHAPACDLPSGWGVSPVGALLDHGVAVGLGTSGGGSNDAGHLLADARLAMQVAPLARPRGATVTARVALTMATAGSARGLGRGELGTLEPGAAADLCCWDLTGVADSWVADPLAGLLWASPGRRPRHVVVAGRVVVRDGVLQTGDEKALASALRRLVAARANTVGRDAPRRTELARCGAPA